MMRIAKFIHSCLLVESNSTRVLFDPGKFSFLDGRVKAESFRDVDAIVITHPHLDHVDPPAVQTILEQNPSATVFGNRAIRDLLAPSGIDVDVFESGQRSFGGCTLDAVFAEHAALLNAERPPNVAYILDGRLLHPGDSFDHALDDLNGIELLALPVMAPWTNELTVAEFAQRLAPKTVFPIHDGYAKEFFLDSRYDNYQKYFAKHGIEFVPLKEPGASLER